MKGYLVYFILLFVLVFPIKVNGAVCSNEDKSNLGSLASNTKISYDYIENNNTVIFNLTLSNIYENMKIKDVAHNIIYNYQGSELTIQNFNPNQSYKFEFYTDSYSCSGFLIYSKYITLPAYNKYYKDSLCDGIENYKLCKKWQSVNLNYDEFTSKINEYKNSLITDEDEHGSEIKGIYDFIFEFYSKYYYIILPLIIISSIITIYYRNKKNDLF